MRRTQGHRSDADFSGLPAPPRPYTVKPSAPGKAVMRIRYFVVATLVAASLHVAAAADDIPLRVLPYSPSLNRSEEHTSELQSLMRISYAVFCLKKKK